MWGGVRALSEKDGGRTYHGVIKVGATTVALGLAFVLGWTRGYERGLEDAVRVESGVLSLKPLPDPGFPVWVEPATTVLLVVLVAATVIYGLKGGLPRV